jgi:hypothetical protein
MSENIDSIDKYENIDWEEAFKNRNNSLSQAFIKKDKCKHQKDICEKWLCHELCGSGCIGFEE